MTSDIEEEEEALRSVRKKSVLLKPVAEVLSICSNSSEDPKPRQRQKNFISNTIPG